MNKIIKWIRKTYNKSIHSIGFYPALIAVIFLIIFILVYRFEHGESADSLKRKFLWLNLKNAEAARSILTTIATGVIGLAVFSFSMVMVVMSQAASQMSNRVLDNLIGNRFQQITLGFYIATIVVSFFLLSVVDDKASSFIPSLSVFLLMALTIIDLFLFIAFLHYITQSVRFENLIKRIHNQTVNSLQKFVCGYDPGDWKVPQDRYQEIPSPVSGYFQGINRKQLVKFAVANDVQIEFLLLRCTYVLKGCPLLKIYSSRELNTSECKELFENIDFYNEQEIDKNPFYGFLHLSEVAIKALSPGINDPNTAVLSIHALTNLLHEKINSEPLLVFKDSNNKSRIFLRERSFEEIFLYCIHPIFYYGKNDMFVLTALEQMIGQLSFADRQKKHVEVLLEFKNKIQQHVLSPK